ncbi:Ribonuclease H2, subunit C [Plasmopara halstedii]|uniref:Ribonuclease H2, subunit C n=1 Tax=Plasmopara halstedii TaxID=4781 RepID=A0A0N7L8B6_PLAHL|nr:Ribonuclease H2, subunit C [Plasmopara halstedii]CEG49419.1 Ribonuclease H2, subunit C [Plasmopara halstedii]|eukprot:XP_024585788.1 Ribonuclease H2, subunit C [Plasmopara halstedii]
MAESTSSTVRVCLTRCPLPTAANDVHSLPCRIHFDGPAAVKTFFRPQNGKRNSNSTDHGGLCSEEQDTIIESEQMDDNSKKLYADFRGIRLEGEKLSLATLGCTGVVLEDCGMRHPDDEGRIWEVDDHFDEITWWDVPNHTTSDNQQLPLVLQQWCKLASAIHG